MTSAIEERRRGEAAEDAACALLRRWGYRIVERNWGTRRGEIDIIARDGAVLAFVEVKIRLNPTHGGPEAAVDIAKQRRIIAAAEAYLAATACDLPVRFDVVAFLGGEARLYRDAFQVDGTCLRDW
jgi:putative endonuclease